MYDRSQILGTSGLYQRIGVREPTKTGYTSILDAASKTSNSGRYYDEFHELANFINIYDCQNDKDISNPNVNLLILNWQKEAIETSLKSVFYDRQHLLQNGMVYANENVFKNKITNAGKFVGFEIDVPQTDDIVNVLNNVVLQFDGVATFNYYLFHSSKKAYLETAAMTSVADDYAEASLGKNLYFKSSVSSKKYASGKFYFGYFQDNLGSVQAYDRIWNNAGVKTRFNCLSIRPISATANGTNMFDIDTMTYTSECWGLNLDISSFRDYTNLILVNKAAFDDLQGYAFAIKVLEVIKTTGRINPTQRLNAKLPEIANFELADQVEPIRRMGLYSKMEAEVKKIRKSLFNQEKFIIGTA